MDRENDTLVTRSGCLDSYGVVNMCSWWFIFKVVVLSLLTATIVIGNSLIITAVLLYKRLRKSISNSFIASLSLADWMLGVVVLPFSLFKEVYGYWPFGLAICQTWLIVDVWVCTASILHLCAISIDRYIAIAHPLDYRRLMTHKRCRVICTAMWVLSFVICFPALLIQTAGGDQSTDEISYETAEDINATSSSMSNYTQDLNATAQPVSFENVTSTYIMTFNTTMQWMNFDIDNTTIEPKEESYKIPAQCDVVDISAGYTVYSALGSFFIPSIIMTGFYIKIFLLARQFMTQAQKGKLKNSNGNESSMRVHRGPSTRQSLYRSANTMVEMTELLAIHNKECKKDARLSTDDSFENQTSSYELSQPSHSQPETNNNSPSHSTYRRGSRRSEAPLLSVLKRQKTTMGSAMNRETRAAKTVAIIVGVFILCWTPFFICYLLQGVSNIEVNSTVFNVFIWVGYINSLLNPCIYAYFSMDYRHAFKQILRCRLKRDRNRKTGLLRYVGSLYVSSSSERNNSITIKPQHFVP